MTRLIGDAYIAVLADTTGFGPSAKQGIDRQLGLLHPSLRVNADTAQAKAQIAELAALIKGQKFSDINVGLNTAKAQADFARLVETVKSQYFDALPLGLDTTKGKAQFEQFVALVRAQHFDDLALGLDTTRADEQLAEFKSLVDHERFDALGLGLDTDRAKEQLAQLVSIVKSQDGLNNIDVGLDTATALFDLGTLRATADALKERLQNIPVTADDAQSLASIFALITQTEKLRDKLTGLQPDGDFTPYLAKFYSVQNQANQLEAKLSHLDPDMDPDEAISTLAVLRLDVSQLSDRLNDLRIDPDDVPALAKFAQIQAVLSSLARQLHSLPMDADTTGIQAKILSTEVQVENLAKKLGPSSLIINPDDMPAAREFAALYAQAQNLSDKLEDIQLGLDPADLAKVETELAAVRTEMDSLSKGTSFGNLGGSFMPAYLQGLDAEVKKVSADLAEMPKSVDVASANTMFEGMSERLANVDAYLKKTGIEGTESFNTLGMAVEDVGERLSVLQKVGIGPDQVSAVRSLDAAVSQLSKDTGYAAVEADTAYKGFGIFGRAIAAIKNTSIPLFGGALEGLAPKFIADASGIHLIVEAVVELVAVWGPATLAMAAFAALSYVTAKDIYTQFTNMGTVAQATGAKFVYLKSTLSNWETAIQPEVVELFGDYLSLAGNNASEFGKVMQSVGGVLDKFGAELVTDLNSKTTSTFLSKASGDIEGLGVAFTQVGRIIGDLLKDVPGYAEMLLKLGDGVLSMSADIIGAINPVIAVFLKLHGAIFYIGLATTALLTFGRAFAAAGIAKSAEAFGQSESAVAQWATSFTSDNEKVAEEAGNSGSRLSKWAEGLGSTVGNLAGVFAIGFGKIVTAFKILTGAATTAGLADSLEEISDAMGKLVSKGAITVEGVEALTTAMNGLRSAGTDAAGIEVLERAIEGLKGTDESAAAVEALTGSLNTLKTGAAEGAAKTSILSKALSLVPFSGAGTAIASVGVAVLATTGAIALGGIGLAIWASHLRSATAEANSFGAAMQKLILSSDVANFGQNITLALQQTSNKYAQVTKQLNDPLPMAPLAQYNKALQSIPQNVSEAQQESVKNILRTQSEAASATAQYNEEIQKSNPYGAQRQSQAAYLTQLNTIVAETDTYGQRMSALVGIFGSVGGAQAALSATGSSVGKVITENNKDWATQLTELSALGKGYGFMGQQAGAAGGQLNTLAIATGSNTKNLQSLVGAEQQWIALITGGESAFTTFEQGFSNLTSAMGKVGTSGATVNVTLGHLTEKFNAVGASMSGTDAASLATRQAFDSQLGAATTLYGSLQTLAAAQGNTVKSGNELAKSGKDIVAQLLPFAAGSKQATGEVSDLAQIMGGPATDNFQTLAKWVGNTKGAEADLNTEQAKLTIGASNLSVAAKNLGNALSTMVTGDEATAIAKTANLSGATQGLATAMDNAHGKVSSTAVSFAGEYVAALTKAGISTTQSKQYLDAYLKQLGLSPAAIANVNSALSTSVAGWNKQDAAVAQNSSAQKAFQVDTKASQTALQSLSSTLPGTSGQINTLWAAIVKQDATMVKSGNDATGAKTEFENFAHDGLGVATSAANTLWAKFGNQNLDMLASKAANTKSAFIDMAEHALGLTTSQAKTLWAEFAAQNLDEMVTKGDGMKAAFIQLAEKGLGYTATQANSLWGTLKNQYLDTLAGKANETKEAFVKTAEQLGDTAVQATNLWNKLHQVAGNYKANVSVNVSGGGKISASVNVTDGSLTTTPATTTQQAGQTNKSGKPLPGLAVGGVVPSFAGGGKLAGWHNGGDNMIAGLANGGAVALQGGEAVVPKNLATHPAFTSFAKYHGIPGYASGGLLQGSASYSQAATTGSSLSALAEPALAQQIGNQTANVLSSNLAASLKAAQQSANAANISGPLGPASAGTVANGVSIFKYLMAYAHMTPIAAAGAIASIYGESGWNPLAAGTGGRGLIGWTPPSTISDSAYKGGLSTQLPQVLRFISTSGDWGVISEMNKASSIFQAANEWGKGVERYGINDVHAEGLALATSIMNNFTKGGGGQIVNGAINGGTTAGNGSGIVANGYSYAHGGRVKPYSTGGTINEPVSGVGSYSGLPYSFGENGPEVVSNVGQVAAAGNPGMQGATNISAQAMIALLQMIVKQNQQLPNVLGKAIGSSGRSGVQHGFYSPQN